MLETSALPDDVDALKAMLKAAHDEIARHRAELRGRDLMIEKLKARLDKQLRDRFGSSAEGIEQLQLMLEDLEITRSAEVPAADLPGAPKDKPVRKPLPDHLPRREHILEPGAVCADCGGSLKRVGEDVTEELEYIPGRFVVNR